jgi:hypothetical protein
MFPRVPPPLPLYPRLPLFFLFSPDSSFLLPLHLHLLLPLTPADISHSYEKGFRELSKKYFSDMRWLDVDYVSDMVDGDEAFMPLYKLLYYRHLLMTLPTKERPALMSEYAEAWDSYRDFFDAVLCEFPSNFCRALLLRASSAC